MKLLILGGTGRTGQALVALALEAGHGVHAIVRDIKKFSGNFQNLQLFEGHPFDEKVLKQALTGTDTVISALNVSRKSDWPWAKLRSPEDLMSKTMELLIPCMKEEGTRRLVVVSAFGVAETRANVPGWFRWLIDNSNIRYPYTDHERQEAIIARSGLDYTIVRPTGLTNSKKTKPVKVITENAKPRSMTVSRRSVAKFILDHLEDAGPNGKKIGITG